MRMPRSVWKAITAARVWGPKAPSIGPGSKPSSLSRSCSCLTEPPLAPLVIIGPLPAATGSFAAGDGVGVGSGAAAGFEVPSHWSR
ncbi:hypothetical protein D3C72_614740 [compost metagenome]